MSDTNRSKGNFKSLLLKEKNVTVLNLGKYCYIFVRKNVSDNEAFTLNEITVKYVKRSRNLSSHLQTIC